MSTGELVPVLDRYPALAVAQADLSDLKEALEANASLGGFSGGLESLLTKIKLPKQGETEFQVPAADGGTERLDELVGIIVYRGPRGVVWPSKNVRKGTLPTLRSDDLKVAYEVGSDWGRLPRAAIEALKKPDGTYDWNALAGEGGPVGWPAADDKTSPRGRIAKEQRVIAFLGENQVAPWLMFFPSTSVRNIDLAIRKMSMPSAACPAPTPYYGCEVRLTAEVKEINGNETTVFSITPKGKIDKQYRDAIKRNYTDLMAEAVRNIESEGDDHNDDLA